VKQVNSDNRALKCYTTGLGLFPTQRRRNHTVRDFVIDQVSLNTLCSVIMLMQDQLPIVTGWTLSHSNLQHFARQLIRDVYIRKFRIGFSAVSPLQSDLAAPTCILSDTFSNLVTLHHSLTTHKRKERHSERSYGIFLKRYIVNY
jgi:phosphoheptose isomerase